MLLALLLLTQAHAFVENATRGYNSCLTCHASPAGGGLLTEYGRSLSSELMSTWTWKDAEQPLFGLARNGETYLLGGDVRSIQTYTDNKQVRRGRLFLMQQNVEAGVRYGKVLFVAALGTQEGPTGTPERGTFLSERHYALWDAAEDVKVRAGKFRLNYGLGDPNHTRATKQLLGFGSLSETYNLEVTKITEKWELSLSSGLGHLDRPHASGDEKSIAATFAHYVAGKSRVGFSSLLGETATSRRFAQSVFAVLPAGEKGVLKLEADYQRTTTGPEKVELVASDYTYGYRLFKGFMPYVIFEHASSDLRKNETLTLSPGVGVQWLPLPHFELQAEVMRVSVKANPGDPTTAAFLLAHFYL